jgi:1-acyl-sn-glycerol-3-phosphate acyltransferase
MSNGRSLNRRDPAFIKSMVELWDWLYNNYYKVKTSGWHNVPDGKILFVGSHNGGLASPDLAMFSYDWVKRYGTERALYGLMHKAMWQGNKIAAGIAEKMGAIEAHPVMAFKAFENDASLLVFPGGGIDVFRPFHLWDKVHLANHKGFIKLALKSGVPIVPWVSVGAHHTLYVLADYAPLVQQLIKMGMPWPFPYPEVLPLSLSLPSGLTLGPVPNIPIPRTIHYKICKPIYLNDKPEPDKRFSAEFINDCYNKVLNAMQKELDDLILDSPYSKKNDNIPELTLS